MYHKLLTTSDPQKRQQLLEKARWLPEASSLNFEFHNSDGGIKVRVVYNEQKVDFCGLKNAEEGFLCSVKVFEKILDRLSDHNYKRECGMHLKHKIPELKRAEHSNFLSNLILCILIALTLVFAFVGWMVRKRYKKLTLLIEEELGYPDKKTK